MGRDQNRRTEMYSPYCCYRCGKEEGYDNWGAEGIYQVDGDGTCWMICPDCQRKEENPDDELDETGKLTYCDY